MKIMQRIFANAAECNPDILPPHYLRPPPPPPRPFLNPTPPTNTMSGQVFRGRKQTGAAPEPLPSYSGAAESCSEVLPCLLGTRRVLFYWRVMFTNKQHTKRRYRQGFGNYTLEPKRMWRTIHDVVHIISQTNGVIHSFVNTCGNWPGVSNYS